MKVEMTTGIVLTSGAILWQALTYLMLRVEIYDDRKSTEEFNSRTYDKQLHHEPRTTIAGGSYVGAASLALAWSVIAIIPTLLLGNYTILLFSIPKSYHFYSFIATTILVSGLVVLFARRIS